MIFLTFKTLSKHKNDTTTLKKFTFKNTKVLNILYYLHKKKICIQLERKIYLIKQLSPQIQYHHRYLCTEAFAHPSNPIFTINIIKVQKKMKVL